MLTDRRLQTSLSGILTIKTFRFSQENSSRLTIFQKVLAHHPALIESSVGAENAYAFPRRLEPKRKRFGVHLKIAETADNRPALS
jgi:hypothetical protein